MCWSGVLMVLAVVAGLSRAKYNPNKSLLSTEITPWYNETELAMKEWETSRSALACVNWPPFTYPKPRRKHLQCTLSSQFRCPSGKAITNSDLCLVKYANGEQEGYGHCENFEDNERCLYLKCPHGFSPGYYNGGTRRDVIAARWDTICNVYEEITDEYLKRLRERSTSCADGFGRNREMCGRIGWNKYYRNCTNTGSQNLRECKQCNYYWKMFYHIGWECDGVHDCCDWSDELNCPDQKEAPYGEHCGDQLLPHPSTWSDDDDAVKPVVQSTEQPEQEEQDEQPTEEPVPEPTKEPVVQPVVDADEASTENPNHGHRHKPLFIDIDLDIGN